MPETTKKKTFGIKYDLIFWNAEKLFGKCIPDILYSTQYIELEGLLKMLRLAWHANTYKLNSVQFGVKHTVKVHSISAPSCQGVSTLMSVGIKIILCKLRSNAWWAKKKNDALTQWITYIKFTFFDPCVNDNGSVQNADCYKHIKCLASVRNVHGKHRQFFFVILLNCFIANSQYASRSSNKPEKFAEFGVIF